MTPDTARPTGPGPAATPLPGPLPTPLPGRVPVRVQRRRTAGWRMPAGAVYVGRPTRWGNPYRHDGTARGRAAAHAALAAAGRAGPAGWVEFGASTGQGGTWANRTEVLWSNRPLRLTEQLTLGDPA